MDMNALLTAKRLGAPTWVWIAGGTAIGAFVLLKMRASKTASTTSGAPTQGGQSSGTGTWSTTGTDAAGNTTTSTFSGPAYSPGFLSTDATMPPQQQAGDIFISQPPATQNGPSAAPPPDTFSGGRDLGQYLTGSAQMAYLNANIGKYGLTQAEVNDVQKAYGDMIKKVGQAAADAMHYSYITAGNVQAIPVPTLTQQPPTNVLAPMNQTTATVVQGGLVPAGSGAVKPY